MHFAHCMWVVWVCKFCASRELHVGGSELHVGGSGAWLIRDVTLRLNMYICLAPCRHLRSSICTTCSSWIPAALWRPPVSHLVWSRFLCKGASASPCEEIMEVLGVCDFHIWYNTMLLAMLGFEALTNYICMHTQAWVDRLKDRGVHLCLMWTSGMPDSIVSQHHIIII